MTRRAGLGVGLAAAVVLAIPASAAAPKVGEFTNPAAFKGRSIVEGVSIGGLKVGMSKSRAVGLWGKPDGICRRGNPYDPDDRRRSCSYGMWVQTKSGKESDRPYAGFAPLPSGEVTMVWISATKYPGSASRRYRQAAREVLPFKTAKNIGLRSTMEAARRAYGVPLPDDPAHRSANEKMIVVRQPQGCTVFISDGSKPTYTYIDSIWVTSVAWCPKDPAEDET